MSFHDHFSGHAASYARFRPTYPDELFLILADSCAQRRLAWDCATGNGQAAAATARHFERVIATDASAEQIKAAVPRGGVEFRVARAEESGIEDRSVDLITVAQALHWFDIDGFFAEAERVLAPEGVLAVWSYERCSVNVECNRVIGRIFAEVEEYWPPERSIVDSGYKDVDMPFTPLSLPPISMKMQWTVTEALGYFRTWSASRRYLAEHGTDPFARLEEPLRIVWGGGRRSVCWPLTFKAGRA